MPLDFIFLQSAKSDTEIAFPAFSSYRLKLEVDKPPWVSLSPYRFSIRTTAYASSYDIY